MMDRLNSVSWTGAGMAVIGSLSINDWLGIVGVSLAFVGMCANIWYKRKTANAKIKHNEEMLAIEREKLEREFPKDEINT